MFICRKIDTKLGYVYIIRCLSPGKLISSCGMYISSGAHLQESCYKVAVCIYHHVFISWKIDIKLPYVYIIRCSTTGKFIQTCGMYISSGDHLQESWYKVALCIYHLVFICRKIDIKLRYVYIIKCLFEEKLIQSCSIYISSRVHLLENWYKVAVSIYHQVFMWRKVDIKLQYVYIISCASAGKLI